MAIHLCLFSPLVFRALLVVLFRGSSHNASKFKLRGGRILKRFLIHYRIIFHNLKYFASQTKQRDGLASSGAECFIVCFSGKKNKQLLWLITLLECWRRVKWRGRKQTQGAGLTRIWVDYGPGVCHFCSSFKQSKGEGNGSYLCFGKNVPPPCLSFSYSH